VVALRPWEGWPYPPGSADHLLPALWWEKTAHMAGWRAVAARHATGFGLVLLAMAGFVAGVYVVVVRGGGTLIGRTDSPHLGLSVLATAIVALGFEPVLSRVRQWSAGLVHGGRAAPYEVLTRFSQVTGTYPTEEVPARMARLLAKGTGAAYAQVWLVVDGRLTLASTWPPSASAAGAQPDPADEDGVSRGRRVLPVHHADELLGVLLVQEHDRQPLTPVEEKLFSGLAAQAGLVLRTVRLRAELARRLAEISHRAAQLQASRQRIVATQDEERRRLERDIHDGAQQHLVALAVNLRLAQTLLARSWERAQDVFADLRATAADTIETLIDLSRGIYPRALTDAGLVPALRAAAATCPVPVTVAVEELGREPAEVEAALYFCCLEALQNVAKHAHAERVHVRLGRRDGALTLVVADDGAGFAADLPRTGSGLANMRDRIESAGGTLTVVSRPGRGTEITARVPVIAFTRR
jgi:signal transduction histidine kinase